MTRWSETIQNSSITPTNPPTPHPAHRPSLSLSLSLNGYSLGLNEVAPLSSFKGLRALYFSCFTKSSSFIEWLSVSEGGMFVLRGCCLWFQQTIKRKKERTKSNWRKTERRKEKQKERKTKGKERRKAQKKEEKNFFLKRGGTETEKLGETKEEERSI